MKRVITIVLMACLSAACGMTGDLYLPEDGQRDINELQPQQASR